MTKTNWNLGLLYKSSKDPQIEKDINEFVDLCNKFSKKYNANSNFVKSEDKLLKSLQDYESLSDRLNPKPVYYFSYTTSLNSSDNEAQAKISKLTSILNKAENEITFYPLALGKIPTTDQKKYLNSKKLSKYRYLLSRRFLVAKYDLSESEEKIINLKSLPSHSMWTRGFEKLMEKQTVNFKSKELPLPEAINLLRELKTSDRRKLHEKIIQKLFSISDFAESEINAIVNNKKIDDELRKLPKPYSGRILAAEDDETSVMNLVDIVSKNFKISQRFYKVKAKMLKLKELKYPDRVASVGQVKKKYSFDESFKILNKTFSGYDKDFSLILNSMTNNGQIDVYPKKGKSGGAFCSGSHNNPTYVLLNHVNNFESVSTFAHEMGHAIHGELSKKQGVLYEDYSLSSAETASTFFEGLVFKEMTSNLSKQEKIVALHDKIEDDISTIFRQIAFFNFELELHNQIRDKGEMSKEEIAKLMNKHMESYLGPIFQLDEIDGYFFTCVSHIRYMFYVYTYAYGSLVSKSLLALVNKDKNNISKVKKFLEAGGSDTPENIFKSIGIDVTKPDFFKNGLKEIENDVDDLEKLVNSAE